MWIDSPYAIKPGEKVSLKRIATDDTGSFKTKEDGEAAIAKNAGKLPALQDRFYAEASRSILVILQAMDAGGKDGAIRHVFSSVDPQGCFVTSFKAPSTLERSHDFLWRHHLACPSKGMIGIHNRSHYEAVLVERVRDLAPKSMWSSRYEAINAFEESLVSEGTIILKFFLHISKQEQRERLQARVDDKQKHWKFNPEDLKEREYWDDYQTAYADALSKCSTKAAPWYCIPSDRKWFRNWAIGDILLRAMEKVDPKYPPPAPGVAKTIVK